MKNISFTCLLGQSKPVKQVVSRTVECSLVEDIREVRILAAKRGLKVLFLAEGGEAQEVEPRRRL